MELPKQHQPGLGLQCTGKHGTNASTRPLGSMTKVVSFVWLSNIKGFQRFFNTGVWVPSVCAALTSSSVLFWSLKPPLRAFKEALMTRWLLGGSYFACFCEFMGVFAFAFGIWWLAKKSTNFSAAEHQSYQMLQMGTEGNDNDENASPIIASNEITSNNRDKEDDLNSILERKREKSKFAKNPIELSRLANVVCLIAVILTVVASFCLATQDETNSVAAMISISNSITSTLTSILFFSFLSISLLGWSVFNLSVLQLTQLLIVAPQVEFGGVEQVLVGSGHLVRDAAVLMWASHTALRWLSLIGLGIVVLASVAHLWWTSKWKAEDL
ncbi:MAG: hypothetical protein Q9159_005042 [Coniocarpon cinnabarinum]